MKGFDENCSEYIENASSFVSNVTSSVVVENKGNENFSSELQYAIVKGLKEKASEITKTLLSSIPALQIVNEEIIPALNIVGDGFEHKTVYLPQLLMSAEAAKGAFEVIKAYMSGKEKTADKGTFVIATVYGDIHDIGKMCIRDSVNTVYFYKIVNNLVSKFSLVSFEYQIFLTCFNTFNQFHTEKSFAVNFFKEI